MLKIVPIFNVSSIVCVCATLSVCSFTTSPVFAETSEKTSNSELENDDSEVILPVEEEPVLDDAELIPVTHLQPSPGNFPELNQPAPGNNVPTPLTNKLKSRSHSSGNVHDHSIRRGLSLLRCEQPMAALDLLQCSPSANQDIRERKLLTVGAAFGELDMISEARCYYNRVAHQTQNEETRRLAHQSIRELNQYVCCREEERFWFSIDTYYDSNPAILPIFNAVGIPDQNADSTVANSYLFGYEKDIARTDDTDLTVGAVAYGSENYSGHEYDIGRYSGYLRYIHRAYMNCTPTYSGLLLNYDYVTVGDDSFLNTPSISTWTTLQHDDQNSTVLYADYKFFDFLGQGALNSTALDTDSNYGRVGITERHRFTPCDKLLVALGYQYALNDSDGSDYDYGSHNIISYLLWEVPESRTLVTLGAEYHIRDYDNANSIVATTTRSDREWIIGGEISHPIHGDWYLTLDAWLDVNDSNLTFNEYDRVRAGAGLEYRFPHSFAERSRDFRRF